jgi:hypothetical protein
MEKVTDEFVIVDAKGVEYLVFEITTMIRIPAAFGETEDGWQPGTKRVQMINGTHVNIIGDGEYEVVDGLQKTHARRKR